MSNIIKTVTDKNLFEKMFYQVFLENKVFLRTKNGDLNIKFLGYANKLVALSIPYVKNMPEQCLIFTRYQQNTIYAHLKLVEKQEDESFIFIPVKAQIITAARREDRKTLDIGGSGKNVLYVYNTISDYILQNSLALNMKKVDHIKGTVRFDLEKQFKNIKIYFFNEGTSDVRMKYFSETRTPYLIQDINKPDLAKDKKFHNFYLNEIYSKDYFLMNRKTLISEIAVPVLYKGRIPYGYIQVNHEVPLSDSQLMVTKRMAIVVEELFTKSKFFPVTEDKLLVADVSRKGVGIVFRERKYIRLFKENSYVYFDIILPAGKKTSCVAIVRNIGILENKIIKVGCQIDSFDAIGEVNWEEYLAAVGNE